MHTAAKDKRSASRGRLCLHASLVQGHYEATTIRIEDPLNLASISSIANSLGNDTPNSRRALPEFILGHLFCTYWRTHSDNANYLAALAIASHAACRSA